MCKQLHRILHRLYSHSASLFPCKYTLLLSLSPPDPDAPSPSTTTTPGTVVNTGDGGSGATDGPGVGGPEGLNAATSLHQLSALVTVLLCTSIAALLRYV